MTRPLELKAVYSINELARAMGIDRFQMRRILIARHVPMDRTDGRCRIWLSSLQQCAPDAWESLLLVQALTPRERR